MKQNNYNRQNRRFNGNNRNNRPTQTIYRNTCLDSSGPAGKLHGTPLQLNEKYNALAKDAATANDMILAEQYRQYADHYIRIQAIAIENENALRAAKEAQQAATMETANNTQNNTETPVSDTDTPEANQSPAEQQPEEPASLETESQ